MTINSDIHVGPRSDVAAETAETNALKIAAEPTSTHVPSAPSHPLGPLSASEITQSSDLIRSAWPENAGLYFKVITLREPAKKELVPYLAAERAGEAVPSIDRRAFVVYSLKGTASFTLSRYIINITLTST